MSEKEQKIREFPHKIHHLSQQNENLEQNVGYQARKLDKKDEFYNNQTNQLNKTIFNLEKEKDDLNFKLLSLSNELNEFQKNSHDEVRQKDRKINEEKLAFLKKISTIEAELQQKHNQINSLNNELETVQSQLKELRLQYDRKDSTSNKLMNHEEELMLQQEKL